jgi:quercetin dioxygenase-like cupin family protein
MKPLVLIASALFALSIPYGLFAQGPGLTRTEKLRQDLTPAGREVRQVLVSFAPHAQAGRHSHPGEEIAYVISGELVYELDGQPPVTLRPGDSLFIPSGAVHAVRNTGAGAAAELATYLVDKTRPLLVPAE